MDQLELEKLEIDLLLDAVNRRYGYDFRHYASTSLKRRIQRFLGQCDEPTVADLIPRLLHDKQFFQSFLFAISVTVTEMFRDPHVYKTLREQAIPQLKTYPFLKIWVAGCATGEEVYSLAILLEEEGLLKRCQLYATDINEEALSKARQGIYDTARLKEYTVNYQSAGGHASFADYYHSRYGSAIMRESLRKNIVFSGHNLVTDAAFGEMHLVVCRNVLIYFDNYLQNRVLGLFRESLAPGGFLLLGTKESLLGFPGKEEFVRVGPGENLFQRRRFPEDA